MWGVLRLVCTAVGALVLYSLVTAGLWALLAGALERRGRRLFVLRADGRTAAGERRSGERRRGCWSDVPGWVAENREWAAAVVLLGAPAIAERTHRYVHFADRRVDWTGLLAESTGWGEGEQLLVLAAYDLSAAAGGPVLTRPFEARPLSLHQLADADETTVRRVTAAIDLTGGAASYADTLARTGGLG